MQLPVITGITPELRSRGLDRLRFGWHVRYEFCGLSAEIAVLTHAPKRSIDFAAAVADHVADAMEGIRPRDRKPLLG
jgi:hypothetical protein